MAENFFVYIDAGNACGGRYQYFDAEKQFSAYGGAEAAGGLYGAWIFDQQF